MKKLGHLKLGWISRAIINRQSAIVNSIKKYAFLEKFGKRTSKSPGYGRTVIRFGSFSFFGYFKSNITIIAVKPQTGTVALSVSK